MPSCEKNLTRTGDDKAGNLAPVELSEPHSCLSRQQGRSAMPEEDVIEQTGTAADETLTATGGKDLLRGGGGKDTFVFRTTPEFDNYPGDTLQDGDRIGDYVSLEPIVVEGTTLTGGQVSLNYDAENDQTRIELDFDRDGTADKTITLDGDKRGTLRVEPACCGGGGTVISIEFPAVTGLSSIPGIYLALFSRPADPLGLAFFNQATGNGADLTAIGDLAATAEYQNRFIGFTPAQIITEIYRSLFDRNPELAGLNYFVGELVSGRQTINTIAINILDGAQGEDRTILQNKIAAAVAFTAALDTSEEILAYSGDAAAALARAMMSAVTADPATIPNEDAIDAVIAGLMSTGQTFLLTTGDDDVEGTSGDDIFRADPLGGLPTLNSGDVVVGGGGNDQIIGQLVGGGTVSPTLIGLTDVFLKFSGGTVFDAGNAQFSGTIWSDGSAGFADFVDVPGAITIGIRGSGTGSLATVTTSFAGAVGHIALDNANGETFVTPNALTKLSINVLSGSSLRLDADQTETLEVVMEADFSLSIRSAEALDGIVVLSSAGDAFDLEPFEVAANDFNFIGGSGDEKVVLIATTPGQTTFVTTRDGDDHITTSYGDDRIDAGDGDDIVVPGSGADLITLGDGRDRVVFRRGDSDDDPTNLTTITDLDTDDDVLDLRSFDATKMEIGKRQLMQQDINTLDPSATLRDALEIAGEYAAEDEITHFWFKGDTYVYVDETNPSDSGYAAGDFVLKVIGVQTFYPPSIEN
jgi:Ca2+-binding RTX toxin-like protein